MAAGLDEQRITCPYCGEPMHIVLDTSAGDQSYIEDCQICCQPMQIEFATHDGELDRLQVNRAD
jgi:transcription elongation factor Elf1